jgi:hypothetical protein
MLGASGAGPSREAVRDVRGQIIGYIEAKPSISKVEARDRHGRLLGSYDERADTTRDARGHLLGRGNRLMALLVCDP